MVRKPKYRRIHLPFAFSLLALGIIGLVLLFRSQKVYAWWNTGWAYRRQLQIQASDITENLTDFPVLVSLNSANFDFSKAKSDGSDIRFVDADGNLLPYEFESWDHDLATATIWVKVPLIHASSTSDSIFLYYGNAAATDAQSASTVWDSHFALVYHLQQTSSTYTDSTSLNNYGTVYQTVTRGVTGKVGKAAAFTGAVNLEDGLICVLDCLTEMPNSLKMQTSDMSVSFWAKTDSLSSGGFLLGYSTAGQGVGYRVTQGVSPDSYIRFRLADAVNFSGVNSSNNAADEWHYFTFTRHGAKLYVYMDGSYQSETDNIVDTLPTGAYLLVIGARYPSLTAPGGGVFIGTMDELRISGTARSAPWILADYKSTNNTLIAYACEQTVGKDNCDPIPTPVPGQKGCQDSAPTHPPDLYQIITTDKTATLYFAPAGDPYSYYYLVYGLGDGVERWGINIPYSHSDASIKYTVSNLIPNTKYFFKIRAGNGCRTGDWSKVMNVKTDSRRTLGGLLHIQFNNIVRRIYSLTKWW